jgi:hypothetical protein
VLSWGHVEIDCLPDERVLALALWVGHTLRNLLYGVTHLDYVSLSAAAIVLAAAAWRVGCLPTAARVDPLIALRG